MNLDGKNAGGMPVDAQEVSAPPVGESPRFTAPSGPIQRARAWLHYDRRDRLEASSADPGLVPLVSYPKAGRTWLRFMLAELFKRHYQIALDRPTIKLDELAALDPRVPRVFETHDRSELVYESGVHCDPYELFIHGRRERYRNSRVILGVRDPRDTVVSYFHQVTRRSDRPLKFPSLGAFVRHPVYGIDRVLRFYQIWHRNRSVPRDLLLVRYEDMLADSYGKLRQVAAFLGLDPTDGLIREVVDFARAENLRDLERRGAVEGMRLFGDDPNSLKVRKARSGTYREELSVEDIAFCDRKVNEMPSWYGYHAS